MDEHESSCTTAGSRNVVMGLPLCGYYKLAVVCTKLVDQNTLNMIKGELGLNLRACAAF